MSEQEYTTTPGRPLPDLPPENGSSEPVSLQHALRGGEGGGRGKYNVSVSVNDIVHTCMCVDGICVCVCGMYMYTCGSVLCMYSCCGACICIVSPFIYMYIFL